MTVWTTLRSLVRRDPRLDPLCVESIRFAADMQRAFDRLEIACKPDPKPHVLPPESEWIVAKPIAWPKGTRGSPPADGK